MKHGSSAPAARMLLVRTTFEHDKNCGVVLAKTYIIVHKCAILWGVSHLPDIINGDDIVSFDPS